MFDNIGYVRFDKVIMLKRWLLAVDFYCLQDKLSIILGCPKHFCLSQGERPTKTWNAGYQYVHISNFQYPCVSLKQSYRVLVIICLFIHLQYCKNKTKQNKNKNKKQQNKTNAKQKQKQNKQNKTKKQKTNKQTNKQQQQQQQQNQKTKTNDFTQNVLVLWRILTFPLFLLTDCGSTRVYNILV